MQVSIRIHRLNQGNLQHDQRPVAVMTSDLELDCKHFLRAYSHRKHILPTHSHRTLPPCIFSSHASSVHILIAHFLRAHSHRSEAPCGLLMATVCIVLVLKAPFLQHGWSHPF